MKQRRPRHDTAKPSSERRVWESHRLACHWPHYLLAQRWVTAVWGAWPWLDHVKGVG